VPPAARRVKQIRLLAPEEMHGEVLVNLGNLT
jgi:hypothetical protein